MDGFVPRCSPRAAGVRQVSILALGAFKLRFSGKKERKKGQQGWICSGIISGEPLKAKKPQPQPSQGFLRVEMDK